MVNLYTKQCETCGITFQGSRNRRFCCPKCNRISYEFRKNNGIETEKINKETYPHLFRADRDTHLKECVEKAEEMGLSYGMYMAYRRMGIVEVGK